MRRTRVKICGITNPNDAIGAAEAGADAIGLVFAESKRKIDVERARAILAVTPPFVSIFAVFMNQPIKEIVAITEQIRIDTVQLHGRETSRFGGAVLGALGYQIPIVQRIDVDKCDVKGVLGRRIARNARGLALLDPAAGEGQPFDWKLAEGPRCRYILAGGLTPTNVAAAIRITRPFAVDVSTGVEKKPGRKDRAKMLAFVTAVRQTDLELSRADRKRKSADGDD